jgi:hypothetical protein
MATNLRAGLSIAKCTAAATGMATQRMAAIKAAPPIAGDPKYAAPAVSSWPSWLANSQGRNSAATVIECVRKSG